MPMCQADLWLEFVQTIWHLEQVECALHAHPAITVEELAECWVAKDHMSSIKNEIGPHEVTCMLQSGILLVMMAQSCKGCHDCKSPGHHNHSHSWMNKLVGAECKMKDV